MNARPGLIPISMATLTHGAMLGIDVYLRPSPGLPAELLFASHQAIDTTKLESLQVCDARRVLIDRSNRERYQQYLRENWESIVCNDAFPIEKRLGVMNEVVRDVLREEFQQGDTDQILAASHQLATGTVELVNSRDIVVDQLLGILHHDYATFTHCTNVSFYAALLAKHLGHTKSDQVAIALGGLVHDLGKLDIDEKILTTPGKLTSQERSIIERHPTCGFLELADRADICPGQLMMVYQHHERVDGNDYPCNLPGSQIHPWAKICAIVDVFEALTSDRPYRPPMPLVEVVQILEQGGTVRLMVRC